MRFNFNYEKLLPEKNNIYKVLLVLSLNEWGQLRSRDVSNSIWPVFGSVWIQKFYSVSSNSAAISFASRLCLTRSKPKLLLKQHHPVRPLSPKHIFTFPPQIFPQRGINYNTDEERIHHSYLYLLIRGLIYSNKSLLLGRTMSPRFRCWCNNEKEDPALFPAARLELI